MELKQTKEVLEIHLYLHDDDVGAIDSKRENQLRNIAEHTMLTLNYRRTLMYRLSLPYSSVFFVPFVFLSPVDVLFALFRGRVFLKDSMSRVTQKR